MVICEPQTLQCGAACPDFKSDCSHYCPEYRTYNEAYSLGLEPVPDKTVSEFADEEVYLPKKGNKEPGPWRTSRTPFLFEILDNLGAHSRVQYTSVVKGTQLGFTTVGLIWFAYIVKYCPSSMLMLMPTLTNAKRHSKGKVQPLIEANPGVFRGRIQDNRAKDSSNEIYNKEYPGGELIIGGANSAASLRHFTAKYVMRDEVDGYAADVEGEGDPAELVENRTDTFGEDAKFYSISTPTIKGISRIDDYFQDSDQRYYYVPCPSCGTKQRLVWDNIIFTHDEYKLIGDPVYRCMHCGVDIEEHHKTYMLANGEWLAHNPGRENRGYHLSSLYSPLGWLSWKKMVREFLFARKQNDNALLKRFINTRLAQTWDDADQPTIDDKKLFARIEKYGTSIPEAALMLTAAVDVQSSPARLEIEVKAHGPQEESWTMNYHIIDGDPAQEETWTALAEYLWHTDRYHKSGVPIKVAITLIDSGGHFTQQVYDFCRKYRKQRAFATKGSQFPGKPIFERASRKKGGNKNKVDFFIGTDTAKDTLFSRLSVEKRAVVETELYLPLTEFPVTSNPYYMHFNETCDEEYFAQLVAEKPEKIKSGRRYVRRYVQIRDRNEALDLNVLNLAAIRILKPDWKKVVERLAKKKEKDLSAQGIKNGINNTEIDKTETEHPKAETEVVIHDMPVPAQQDKKTTKTRPAARRGGWVNGWRR